MMKRSFTEQLREFVAASGKTRYDICKATGLDQGNLSRFMRHGTALQTSSIDLLCEYLGLQLVATENGKKRRMKKPTSKGA